MKKYITKTLILFKLSLLSLAFLGCGKGSKPTSEKKKKTAVVEGTSIAYSNNLNETLNTSKIQTLNQQLALLILNQLEGINNKEAISYNKVIEYCDTEGKKEINNYGEINNHTKEITFDHCQEENILQDGSISIAYYQADEDGKFPKALSLESNNSYLFNEIELKKNTHILVNNILYTQALKATSLELKISGEIQIKESIYSLQNFIQKVTF